MGLRIAPQVQLIYHIRFYIITYPLMCHSFNTVLIPFVEQIGMKLFFRSTKLLTAVAGCAFHT